MKSHKKRPAAAEQRRPPWGVPGGAQGPQKYKKSVFYDFCIDLYRGFIGILYGTPGPLGPGSLRPRAPGPRSLRPRAPEAQGPWARVLEAHRPRGPGPLGTPWDPWGDPHGIPGTPPGTPGAKKSVFLYRFSKNRFV